MEGTFSNRSSEFMEMVEEVKTLDQLENASFGVIATFASAAAWAPNPNKPPFYLDLPFENGEMLPEIAAKFTAICTLYVIE